jgi:exodeoxyribonuclease VII large subunit
VTEQLELGAGEHVDALSIVELYNRVTTALARALPAGRGGVWVRGEIQAVSDRTGHLYLDLVDPQSVGDRQAPVLRVKCWRKSWAVMKRVLAREGVELRPGLVVVIRGTLDLFRPRAEINFILAEIDVTALLGVLAAQRAALLRALERDGLLERNRSLALPEVALRIGLVASPGTEGYRDFIGQLEASGFAFCVSVVPVRVQGSEAPARLARALRRLSRSDCDLVVVVRGGGSKADLSAFDAEPVARAIAAADRPVWTGIGHTGDLSVADLVANRSFITPTECGQEVARRLAGWWERAVAAPSADLVARARLFLDAAAERDQSARVRLAAAARAQLRAHDDSLNLARRVLAGGSTQALSHQATHLQVRRARLEPLADRHLVQAAERLTAWRRLLGAYDVTRQLERGYTLTLDESGRVVRGVHSLERGMAVVTRFADGTARSTIEEVAQRPGAGPSGNEVR